jgi:riboflavin synthase
MFTGIIEQLGEVKGIREDGSNVHLTIHSSLVPELRIDQSISHNGICLTVIGIDENANYTVTAVDETLQRTNLGDLVVGDLVNLERAMVSGGRLDGHIVQGHVDATGQCTSIEDKDGSWYFHFQYHPTPEHLLVDKGSVCINGVSLTVVNPIEDRFSVAIIPYTYHHTSFQSLEVGDRVNLEFDILGKYIAKYAALYFQGMKA